MSESPVVDIETMLRNERDRHIDMPPPTADEIASLPARFAHLLAHYDGPAPAQPPATDDALSQWERTNDRPLPPLLRAFYRLSDGAMMPLYDISLLSLRDFEQVRVDPGCGASVLVLFADYMLSIHRYGFDPKGSGVYVFFERGAIRVAPSLEAFLHAFIVHEGVLYGWDPPRQS